MARYNWHYHRLSRRRIHHLLLRAMSVLRAGVLLWNLFLLQPLLSFAEE
jgi:hypothetical protein